MKQVRFIGLASTFLVVLIGGLLEAHSEVPELWHNFMDDQYLIQEMFLDSRESMDDVQYLDIEGTRLPIRVPTRRAVTGPELEIVRGILNNDFLVNDDMTGGCAQSWPAVARNQAGNFVICWDDYRDGMADIYAQRYDAAGNPQGDEIRVNDDAGYTYNYYPEIVMDSAGNFVICWWDSRNGHADIWAQRFDASGNPLGANFLVNDDIGRNHNSVPKIAMDEAGNFVICWYDDRDGDYNIYAQRYDAAGNPLGTNFRVDDDPGTNSQYWPAVAMDQVGNFEICWHDNRDGDYNIYAQRYDATGNPLGTNFRVDDDPGTQIQNRPETAMDEAGNFVICWYDRRNGNYDIYAQMYDAAGTPLGANFMVNDDLGTAAQYSPSVAMDVSGNFVITWYDRRNGNYDIYAQMYDAAGTPVGINFKVNDDLGTATQYLPYVAMDEDGNFVICWYDYRAGGSNTDIYAQMYDAAGHPQHPNNVRVNDDLGTADNWYPSVAIDNSGNFVITWYDERNGNNDIWAQRYDVAGNPQGANFLVNDDPGTSTQENPYVAMDETGNFVICWHDTRDGGDYNIYAQMYDAAGNPTGANFRVDDDPGTNYQFRPSIAMDQAGDFVICWYDYRNGNYDIYAQRYDAVGNPQGTNFLVNDDPGTSSQSWPVAAMDEAGNFVICWYDYRNGDADIYVQMYDAAGTPLGANFKVNDDATTETQYIPSLAMDEAGNFVICWEDYRNIHGDIYAQMYDAAGHPQGANFLVNDDAGTAEQWYPSVAMDPAGDRFVVVWTDFRNIDDNPEFVAQLYEDGNPVDVNVQINDPDPFPYCQQMSWRSSAACNSDTLVFAWQDTRRHKGWDIYGKLLAWDFPGIEEDTRREIVGSDLRAYPNPFRSIITIHGADNELEIYDVSGRLVGRTRMSLWDGKDVDGRDVESGVYFLKAEPSVGCKVLKVIKLR